MHINTAKEHTAFSYTFFCCHHLRHTASSNTISACCKQRSHLKLCRWGQAYPAVTGGSSLGKFITWDALNSRDPSCQVTREKQVDIMVGVFFLFSLVFAQAGKGGRIDICKCINSCLWFLWFKWVASLRYDAIILSLHHLGTNVIHVCKQCKHCWWIAQTTHSCTSTLECICV